MRFLFLLLLLSGCGLKTDLVVYDDVLPAPELTRLSHEITNKTLSLHLLIQGGSGLMIYQIDRAVVEPDCKCIGNWLRFYESSPSKQRLDLTRHIRLRRPGVVYVFRVRVMDGLGRKSAWSKVIRTERAGHVPPNEAVKK